MKSFQLFCRIKIFIFIKIQFYNRSELSTIWLINKLSISLNVAWFINFLLNIFGSFCRNFCWRLNLLLHVLLYLSTYTVYLSVSYLSSLNFCHVLTLFPEAKYIKMKSRKTHFEFIVRWFFAFLGQKKVNQVFSFRAFSGFYCIQWFKSFSFYCWKNI